MRYYEVTTNTVWRWQNGSYNQIWDQSLMSGKPASSNRTILCHILLLRNSIISWWICNRTHPSISPDLLVVGEGLNGVQQLGDSGAEQADGHGLGQVLSGQVEHARCGAQVDVQGGGVALHPTQHQLWETRSLCHNHMCSQDEELLCDCCCCWL